MTDSWLPTRVSEIKRYLATVEAAKNKEEGDITFSGIKLQMPWSEFREIVPQFKNLKTDRRYFF
jgi:hypothetical protein